MDAQVGRGAALNDESGPAASIGQPYAEGIRLAVACSNAGELDILPEEWEIELIEGDHLVAFPASLSSEMAEHPHTPPGPPYHIEAMRAMDWAVEEAGGTDEVRAGIVYQQDDYGEDGLEGWREAAEDHRANYVLLTTLPSSSGLRARAPSRRR